MLSFENYSKAANRYILVLLIFVLNLVSTSNTIGQCSIKVPAEPKADYLSKSAVNSFVINCDGSPSAPFDNPEGFVFLDDISSRLAIDPGAPAKCLIFRNFRINLPDESEILGFELFINGQSTGSLQSTNLQFISPNGPMGDNNISSLNGEEWTSNKSAWSYGGINDIWSAGLSMLEVSNPDFGVLLSIENIGNSVAEISIDQVSLRVYYKPLYMVCDHDCITFFTDEKEGIDYEWTMPDDFHVLDGTQVNHIINIVATDNQKGSFDICVDQKSNGISIEKCCRRFILEDCGVSTIGDQVWLDENGNGLQDQNEKGIANVEVELFDEEFNSIQNTNTDQDGFYSFEEVARGFYFIKFTTEAGLVNTLIVANEELNSDVTNLFGKGTTDEFYLAGNASKLDIDAGFYSYGQLGDFIWNDINQNGLQDSDESGFAGVTVQLRDLEDVLIESVVSNTDGQYLFKNIAPGGYQISLVLPSGFTLTSPQAADPVINSDFRIIQGEATTENFTLLSGQSNFNLDAGLIDNTSDITGIVWCDTNQNDRRDDLEIGINDLQVGLHHSDGSLFAVTRTDEFGRYAFNQIEAASYYMVFESEFGKEFSQANIGNDDFDSDVTSNISLGSTDVFDLTLGGEELYFDAGQQINIGHISGLVWQDIELDNLLGVDDDRLDDISVSLYDMASNFISKVQTKTDGSYAFENVKIGHYYLSFMIRDGNAFVLPNVFGDDLSSKVTAANGIGTTDEFEVLPGETTKSLNAGYVVNVSDIKGVVWCDEDRDGLRSADEIRVANIKVELFDSNSNLIKTSYTNDLGEYSFLFNLKGLYFLKFNITNEKVFIENLNSDLAINSDVTGANGPGTTHIFEINLGGDPIYQDAGQRVIHGSIQGVVWLDDDFDGFRESDESLVSSWQIILLNENGENILTTKTNETGSYSFDAIGVGRYSLKFEKRYPYLYSVANIGDDATDSDVINQTGQTNLVNITFDGQISRIDAGVARNVGDFRGVVWCDDNCNGLRDGSEKGEPNVNVYLLDVTGKVLLETETDDFGNYVFTGLAANKYYVKVLETRSKQITLPKVGTNENIDSDITHEIERGSTGTIYINAEIGEVIIDAGLKPIRGSISGIVWDDANYNGQRENHEQLVNGITVQLIIDQNNVVASTITDINGTYAFANILAEDYTLKFINITNHTFTKPNLGSEETDSDVINDTGLTATINILSEGEEFFVDAGIVKNVANISGTVWCDNDYDGVFGAGDSKLANQSVSLVDTNGAVVANSTTDNVGFYQFANIGPASYFIRFSEVTGKTNTTPNAGDLTDISSQITNNNGLRSTDTFNIGPATDDLIYNAGYVLINGTIKGVVWEDEKVDGIRLDFESLVGGMEVSLVQNGEIIATTFTNSNGYYQFERVLQGSYYLYFTAADHFLFTLANVGADNVDSDVTNTYGMGTTVSIDVVSNGQCISVDAGIASGAADVAGYVWCDEDRNGLQSDGESGLSNIEVTIKDKLTDEIVVQTTTDGDGTYRVSKLGLGNYYLIFGLATDKIFTVINDLYPDLNSDVTGTNGVGATDNFEIRLGDKEYYFDAGQSVLTGSVNGTVWYDTHLNGVRNSTEDLAKEISVSLYNSNGDLIKTVETNTTGNYSFSEVNLGDYYLVFGAPECYTYTLSNREDDLFDSDVTNEIVLGSTAIFYIASTALDHNYDMGLVTNAANISGVLWCDENPNGLRESSEALIANQAIELVNALTGTTITRTTSDIDGTYLFAKVPVGMYFIRFEKPNNKEFTIALSGMDMMNSDVTEMNGPGTSDMFMIRLGDIEMILDAGYMLNLGGITGLVWNDMNFNGVREIEEEIWEGLMVTLRNSENIMLAQTMTDENGSYSFLELKAETYKVEFDIPDNYIITKANQGDDRFDSDIDDPNGMSGKIFIMANGDIQTVDLGIIRNSGAAMGVVWCEEKPNGIRETGEAGLSNLTITLFDENNLEAGQTFTNSNGLYSFQDLNAGVYYIQVSGVEGKFFSPANQGNDTTKDSDITGANGAGTSDRFSIGAEQMVAQKDAGMSLLSGMISGRLWHDSQLLGVQDSNQEEGISGVEIKLFNTDNILTNTTISGFNGTYIFNNVPIGTYYLVFDPLQNFNFTLPSIGIETADSDVTGVNGTGSTNIFTITEDETEFDFDAGYVRNDGLISGVIWEDENEDGNRENDENLIEGIIVQLFSQNNTLIQEVTSQSDGKFNFIDVPMGTYYLLVLHDPISRFTLANALDDDELDSDITNSIRTGSTDLFVLLPGEQISNFGAGIVFNRNCVTGNIWEDLDGDGIKEDTEPLISGISVILKDQNDAEVLKTQTDSNGHYKFSDLLEGFYYILFAIPTPYEFTLSDQGDNELIDSDISGELGDGTSNTFEISNNEIIAGVNAGVFIPGSITGEIWKDQNLNSIQEETEALLENVKVQLINNIGTVVQNIVAAAGSYIFSDVRPSDYSVRFEIVDGFNFVNPITTENSSNSDVAFINGLIGTTESFSLISNQDLADIDAGVMEAISLTNSIGNQVFLDNNGNGILDGAETGVNDILVHLFDSSDNRVATTMTADAFGQSGIYNFSELDDGKYYVQVVLDNTLEFTKANVGENDLIDSDVTGSNGTGTTDKIELSGGQNNMSIDIGIFEPVTIGDFIWNDGNANGIQNPNEEGINDVRVRLFDTNLEQVAQSFTSIGPQGENGYYSFSAPPGAYFVLVQLPSGLFFTDSDIGGNDQLDSDVNNANGFGTTEIFLLTSGQKNNTIDAGMLLEPATLGNFVWLDDNGNGIQDEEEMGINEVEVKLFNSQSQLITTTFTTSDIETGKSGTYLFDGVTPGIYYVEFVIPDGAIPTDTDIGGDDTKDSDITEVLGPGTTSMFELSSAETDFDVDAGFYFPSFIGDFVWEDLNQNGIQDTGEPGVAGVEVKLTKQGVTIDVSTTDQNGFYQFINLKQGLYKVSFSQPVGYTFTAVDQGTDDSLDSDAFSDGNTPLISLAHDVLFQDLDAGIFKVNQFVGVNIYHDLNANGTIEIADESAKNIMVNLYNESGQQVAMTPSDSLGIAAFFNVENGKYYIQVQNPDLYNFSEVNINNQVDAFGYSKMFEINDAIDNLVFSAAMYQPVSIKTKVWRDLNGDGIMEDDEPLMNDIPVLLKDDNGAVVSADITGRKTNGMAVINDLKPGNYMIYYQPQPEYIETVKGMDDTGAFDSDVLALENGFATDRFNLISADKLENANAGFYKGGKIGDRVWYDTNHDGIQNDNEEGVPNVTVNLYNGQARIVATTVTDQHGMYSFEKLKYGAYYLEFVVENSVRFTESLEEIDAALNSDVSGLNGIGTTWFFELNPEESNNKIDAGVLFGVLAIDDASLQGSFMGDYNRLVITPVDQTGIKEYVLEKSLDSNIGFSSINTFKADESHSYIFDDTKINNGIYYYRIKEIDHFGQSQTGKIITLTVQMSTKDQLNNIQLYPNPASDYVAIKWSENKYWKNLKLVDVAGKELIFKTLDSNQLSTVLEISDLSKGNYFVIFSNESNEKTVKLSILR